MTEHNSVDPAEVEKFNKLSATWWNETGPMWPLHRLNNFRITVIEKVICKQLAIEPSSALPLSGLHVLDIGCGGGILSESMARRGAKVHGVDVSPGNIAAAKIHNTTQKLDVTYEVTTAEALADSSASYDVVLNMEVIEHVADLAGFMSACNAMVKPGGIQFVSTINRNPWAWFIAIFGAEYVLRWLPKGTHQYRKLVKPSELMKHLDQDNFTLISRTGVNVNPFTRQMSARKSEMVNYMYAAIKAESQTA